VKTTFLEASFEVFRADGNRVGIELWYTSTDDRSLDFIRNMAEYIVPIQDFVDFEPKFVSWSCPNCDIEYKKKNCISDGKYCAMMHRDVQEINGIQVIMENIRQYCVFLL
jgi:hypothetical protein